MSGSTHGMFPFASWDGTSLPLFEMATHNFMGEIPRFFLEDETFSSFVSAPQSSFKPMDSGSTYYMDVVLRQTPDMVVTEGPRKSLTPQEFYHRHTTATGDDGTINDLGWWIQGNLPKSTGMLDWLVGDEFPQSVTQSGNPNPGVNLVRPPHRGNVYGPMIGDPDMSVHGGVDADKSYYSLSGFYKSTVHKHATISGYLPSATASYGSVWDPMYAAWTPPYFYGQATARISFQPHKAAIMDENSAAIFELDEIFANAEVSYVHEHEEISELFRFGDMMTVTSSVDVFGKMFLKEADHDAVTGRPTTIRTKKSPENASWVISPRFECPLLNHDTLIDPEIEELSDWLTLADQSSGGDYIPPYHSSSLWYGTEQYEQVSASVRGLWNTYGRIPASDTGVFMDLRESHPTILQGAGARFPSGLEHPELTGSLIDVCGFRKKRGDLTQKIGQLASQKEISELVVAVPYLEGRQKQSSKTIMYDKSTNRYFFKIDPFNWALQNLHKEKTGYALPENTTGPSEPKVERTSVTDLYEMMKKYIFPPQWDFINNKNSKPFVMYTFEFTHDLNQQDLANIWQGVMPDISVTAEKQDVTVSHEMSMYEFFGGKKLPTGIKWMMFKVKKKAEQNYYNVTADATDDKNFKFDFDVGRQPPKYSYNWPYDYFSLVELTRLDAEVIFESKDD
jgi:hypothetical protein